MTGTENVLINDWCQQYSSHSIGSVLFGADGALYASAGDGAGFTIDRLRPGRLAHATRAATRRSRSAARRSHRRPKAARCDRRTCSRPATRPPSTARSSGSIPRPAPRCPTTRTPASTDPNARRIVATGLRQPFRMTIAPGHERVVDRRRRLERRGRRSTASRIRRRSPIENFGWPCYEGAAKQAGYDALNLDICNTLYGSGAAISPYFTYRHTASVVTGDGCPTGGSSVTGGAFYPATGGSYPAKYRRRPVLRRLHAPLHLGDAAGHQRPAGSDEDRDLRDRHRRRVQPGRPRDRARWRPLLRRPGRRDDPPDPLLPRQPSAGRGARRHPHDRSRAAHGPASTRAVRPMPTRIARPTRGTSTATAVRGLHRVERLVHLHHPGPPHRVAPRRGHAQRAVGDDRDDRRRQHRAGSHDHLTVTRHDLARRRHGQLLGLCERRAGRRAPAVRPALDARDGPLPVRRHLSHAPG